MTTISIIVYNKRIGCAIFISWAKIIGNQWNIMGHCRSRFKLTKLYWRLSVRSISFSVISLIIYRLSPSRSWYTLKICLTINWRSFHPLRGFWSTQNLLSLSELIKIISLQLILLKIFCLKALVIKNSIIQLRRYLLIEKLILILFYFL